MRSTEARIVIKKTVDAKLLEDEAINIAKVDDTIKAALEDAVESAKDLIEVHGSLAAINNNIAELQQYGEEINTVQGTVDAINSRLDEVQALGIGTHNSLVETQDTVTRTIAQVDNNTANITQATQDIATIQTTIENFHIEGDVGDTVEYLQSQITQNANNISATVSKLNSEPTASGQYASITALQSKTTQNADSITNVVTKLNSSASDSGQYTAISELKQTADGISTTVTNNKNTETQHYNGLTSSINQQANRITTIITNLNDSDEAAENYSAIAQMRDNIELRVAKSGVISAINLTPETARIRGKLITLDGDTQVTGYFWANAVEAKSIDVGKINANSLSALSANIGNVTGGTIIGTTVSGSTIIGSTIRNANNTFSVSANGAISGATLTAATINSGTINADLITAAGFNVKASVIGSGSVSGQGDTIPLRPGTRRPRRSRGSGW